MLTTAVQHPKQTQQTAPPLGWCHHIHSLSTCNSAQTVLSIFYISI